MIGSTSLEVVIILALILANGAFALSEMALISARKARLQWSAEAGNASAQTALDLSEDPARYLSAVQVGITLVGILAGAFAGATLAENLAKTLAYVPALAPYSSSLAFGIVVLIITYLTLVIGELAPKQIALNSPERIAMLMARPMKFLIIITRPVVAILMASTNFILKLLRVQAPEGPLVTEEEIRLLIGQATDAGVFEEEEEDLVAGVFRLGDLRAAALMTPRTEMFWLDLADDPETTRSRDHRQAEPGVCRQRGRPRQRRGRGLRARVAGPLSGWGTARSARRPASAHLLSRADSRAGSVAGVPRFGREYSLHH